MQGPAAARARATASEGVASGAKAAERMAAEARIATLDLRLPPELEARQPPEARGLRRDEVRMLVSYRGNHRIHHAHFVDLPRYLRSGDLLVLNISGTLPAALTARRADGTQIAVHVSTELPAGLHVVEFRAAGGEHGASLEQEAGGELRGGRPELPGGELHSGERLALPGGAGLTALTPYPQSDRLWVARLELPEQLHAYLRRWGRPVGYSYLEGSWSIDMYQNVYAQVPGSAEMPSAGRPFTLEILDRLAEAGVGIAEVLLHTGVSSLEQGEPPYEEYFEVSHEAAEAVRQAREAGGRVIAVGTTTVRALESSVDAADRPIASRGWTDVVIEPERGVRLVDGLLTGFHEPEATHLSLVTALAGPARAAQAYRAALEAGYLWHEFGDVHLILPS